MRSAIPEQLKRFFITACLALLGFAQAKAQPAEQPPHFFIPTETISPDGKYGVLMPDSESDEPSKLVDIKTGTPIDTLIGEPGWTNGEGRSMRWGDIEAKWSADSSTLCWIYPGKWFPMSYVVVKLQKGKPAWQVELMKPADREILARTEAAAPSNFAIAKLDNAGDGSDYPEGFVIDVAEPGDKFSLPLVFKVSLTSNCKADDDDPLENGVRSSLTMTLGVDGDLTFTDFKAKPGPLSPDAAEKIKAATVVAPLVDTDLGKALLFPGLISKDGQYAVGWTVEPTGTGTPPVDWSHWDPTEPDKVLRRYDWQIYGDADKTKLPYEPADFVLNTSTGKTARLPTASPTWPGKRDGWEVIADWYTGTDSQRYALIVNGQEDSNAANLWLVNLSGTQLQVQDLTTSLRKAVNDLLHKRRPEVAADNFQVSYPLKANEGIVDKSGLVDIPFAANVPVSDQGEFQLSGTVKIRLADGSVTGAFSDQKRLDPFVTNEALRTADAELNTLFQAELKSLSPKDAQVFKREERDWIAKRDADASQAVNITDSGSTQQAYEEAREKSLLESTNQRIVELKRRTR